jgi:transposase-like protein
MKRNRFTEEQIIAVLHEHEAGAKTADLARKYGISEATLYNWKAKYGGLDVSEARRLRSLEDENRKLKKLLAVSMLDTAALRELLSKKMVGPAAKREAVTHLRGVLQMSERRAPAASLPPTARCPLSLMLAARYRAACLPTRACQPTTPVRLSAALHHVAGRRRGRRHEPHLSALS